MSLVFLSHATEDQPRLSVEIIEPFKRHGIEFWYSKDNITIAESWQDSIRAALARCDWFLLVLSRHSCTSKWVRGEISLAWNRFGERNRLAIARLDDTAPIVCDMRLDALHYVDLFVNRAESLNRLIQVFTGPFPAESSGRVGSIRRPSKISKTAARTPPGPSVRRADILDVFRRLSSDDGAIREAASRELEAADWSAVLDWAEDLAQEGKTDEIGAVLRAVAMLESHAQTVQLLTRLCDRLGGELRIRAVRLLERKHLSLRRENLDSTFAAVGSPYRIIRALGNGLFAASFLARHRVTGLEVVVRVLLDKHAADDEVRAKFMQTTARFSRYVHQRLAMTREVASFPEEKLYFCVRDYVRGTTLQAMFDEGAKFEPEQSLRVLRQVASALEPAHEQGDVHHAVKPSNVYIVNGRDVRLGDPSLPVVYIPPAVQRVLYDARYAAPECFDPEATLTPAADVYSLGCLAYHLLCGRPPFIASTYRDLSEAHRLGVFEPASKRGSGLGAAGDEVLAAMLAVDPKSRPTNPGDVLDTLIVTLRAPDAGRERGSSTLMPPPRGQAIEPQYSIISFEPGSPSPKQHAPSSPAPPHHGPDKPAPPTDQPDSGIGGVAVVPPSEPAGSGAGEFRGTPDNTIPSRDAYSPISISSSGSGPMPATGALGDVTYREQLPTTIGQWRILSRLGEGGFGEVFLAEQETPFKRRVAIKIIKPGMDSRTVLARFNQERQALAMMDHPNIARIIDGGVSEWGRPYFVMEYVQGESITVHSDRNKLTIPLRLDLLARVCDAVHYAHQRGVIHRDIKPNNILVESRNGGAIPKIIDFGVAKSLLPALTEQTIFTEIGQLIGTPEYMSPEQAEMGAADIDTRADIYSLGAVMYELLTGLVPFDPRELRAKGYVELQRMIREVDPARLSTRVTTADPDTRQALADRRGLTPAALGGMLRRELEWIPLKAMRKDRTMRYSSAAQMADDIRNYLQGRPLEAGPESTRYRLRKFATRNRAALLAAVLGAATMAAVVTGIWLAIKLYGHGQ